jgi:hypothetical protein
MPDRGPRSSPAELLLLLALGGWALFPLVLLLLHAATLHAQLTGADGLIGADGVLGADQLQYLAWIRDAATHNGLASDLFTLGPSGHVYLEPLFAVSAFLLRLGLSLQLSYLIWKPVAVVALYLAARAWAHRFYPSRTAAGASIMALALFLYSPLSSLLTWITAGASSFRFGIYLLADELLPADKLWGYVPSALGLALVPVALLALERALVIIFVALALVRRLGNATAIAVPAIGAGLPLIYYALLKGDPAWQIAAHYEVIPRPSAVVMLAVFGPLAAVAAPGLRRPHGIVIEQLLLLWIGGCFVTYFINDSFATHALQGLSLPWAVLAVRGFERMRLPAIVGLLAIGVLSVPGLAYDARKFARTADSSVVQYYLPSSDSAALAWLRTARVPGGVLAPTPFAAIVPGQTGRRVWTGHGYWSRDYPVQARQVDRLFGGHMRSAQARRFVASTGASILLSDCAHNFDLAYRLGPMLRALHRFGCARVYVLRR